jgi:hypothetical protein
MRIDSPIAAASVSREIREVIRERTSLRPHQFQVILPASESDEPNSAMMAHATITGDTNRGVYSRAPET